LPFCSAPDSSIGANPWRVGTRSRVGECRSRQRRPAGPPLTRWPRAGQSCGEEDGFEQHQLRGERTWLIRIVLTRRADARRPGPLQDRRPSAGVGPRRRRRRLDRTGCVHQGRARGSGWPDSGEGCVMAGKRRFGRVRRLPSGRYQVRYRGPDGIDRPAPETFRTKGDAEV